LINSLTCNDMNIKISLKPFQDLSPLELYQILRLRSEVFVVEQNCVFLDMDNKDQYCDHLMIYTDQLAAVSRLVPPGISYPEMSVGRVASHPSARGTGIGKILMEESLRNLYAKYGNGPIRIGAQYYLKKFYEGFGFRQCSEIYDEDGIDHILMLKLALD
jgi:ElaA protein